MTVENGLVIGDIESMVHEYIFNSRDGAERTSNVEAAKTLLTSLNNLYPIEEFREYIGKKRLAAMFEEIFRMTGSSLGGDIFQLSQEEEEQPIVGGDKANKLLDVVEQLYQRVGQLEASMQGGQAPAPAAPPAGAPSIGQATPEGPALDPASSPVAAAVEAVLAGQPVE